MNFSIATHAAVTPSSAMSSKHYSHLGSKAQTLKAHLGHITTMACEGQVGGGDPRPAVPGKGVVATVGENEA